MTIGNHIRRIRELKEIKQDQVANVLGISLTAYGNIERNKTDINYSRLVQIASAAIRI